MQNWSCVLSSAQHRGTVTVLVLLAMLWLVQAMCNCPLAHLGTSGSFSLTVYQTAPLFCLATFQLPRPQPVEGPTRGIVEPHTTEHIDSTYPDP